MRKPLNVRAMHTQSTRKKMLRSRTFPSHIHPGVPRIFLAAPLSYAAIGLPHDHGEGFWATENSQPVRRQLGFGALVQMSQKPRASDAWLSPCGRSAGTARSNADVGT